MSHILNCGFRNQLSYGHRSYERNLGKPEKVRTSTGFAFITAHNCGDHSLLDFKIRISYITSHPFFTGSLELTMTSSQRQWLHSSVGWSVPPDLVPRVSGCGWSRDHLSIQNRRVGGYSSTFGRKENPVAPAFQQIFLPPRFWVVTWPTATRVSVPTTKGGRKERPWERGCVAPVSRGHGLKPRWSPGFFRLLYAIA